jgi:hypothetical protein
VSFISRSDVGEVLPGAGWGVGFDAIAVRLKNGVDVVNNA